MPVAERSRSRRWLGRWRAAALWRRSDPAQDAAPSTAQSDLQKQLAPIGGREAQSATAIVFVTVLGLSREALEEVAELVAKETEGTPISPVFITDSLEFDPLRRRRLRFEYLPDRGTQTRFAPDLDWALYERRRWALLADKWRPRSLISFGRPPAPGCAELVKSSG